MYPEIPVAPGEEHWLLDTSPDEVYWPCSHSRAIPSFPSQLEWKIGCSCADTLILDFRLQTGGGQTLLLLIPCLWFLVSAAPGHSYWPLPLSPDLSFPLIGIIMHKPQTLEGVFWVTFCPLLCVWFSLCSVLLVRSASPDPESLTSVAAKIPFVLACELPCPLGF